MRASANSVTGAIEAIRTRISDIDERSSSVSVAIEEQTQATTEISRNTDAAAQSAGAVDENIGQVLEQTRASSSSAAEIVSVIDEMNSRTSTLQGSLDALLGRLRAA
jgi:methyl-accepting chemotaxis protein